MGDLPVEAKLHSESKVIQRCFDDNNDDNKRWWQRWWQKAQRFTKEQLKWIKNNSRVQDKNQEEFKTQEERLESRIKIQGSRSQESRSRFKTQDSRMKRILNQDKY